MIEIEEGKVYRLKTGGLFRAERRHMHPQEPQNNHWLMRRLTEATTWEGYGDPLVFDYDRDQYVLREATKEDYTEYLDRYNKELDKLMEQVTELEDIKLDLEDRRDYA